MLAALAVVAPLGLIFFAWFYLFRNSSTVPVTPGAYPIVGHMYKFFDITKANLYEFETRYLALSDPAKYGPVTHIKMFLVSNFSLNTVEVAEPLFKSNTNINKSFQYDDVAGWLKESVLVLPGEAWQKRRRMLTPAFHFNIMDDFCRTMKKHCKILVEEIKPNTNQNIISIMEITIFRNLVETSFGTEFKTEDEVNLFFKCMRDLVLVFADKTTNPLNKYDWYYNRTEAGKLYQKSLSELNAIIVKLIEDRKQDMENGTTVFHNGKRSFLDHLVWEQKQHGELTDEQIIGECNTILLAGHSTTTGTLAFTLYYLAKHPDLQERVYREIQEHLNGRDFDEIEAGSLQYLGMFVKEVLRLQPPATTVARRLSEPMYFDGGMLPRGANVDLNIWAIHRDPAQWVDPDTFNPDRFSPENSKGRNPYAYVPFSAGPRNCIGQRFALLESKLMVAAFVNKFKLSCEQEMGVDLRRDIYDVSIVPGPNLKIDFTLRSDD